jgi:hypothetical protein
VVDWLWAVRFKEYDAIAAVVGIGLVSARGSTVVEPGPRAALELGADVVAPGVALLELGVAVKAGQRRGLGISGAG